MTDASLILELSVEPPVAAATPTNAAFEPATATAPPSLLDAVATVTRGAVVVASPAAKDLPGVELKKRKFAHTSDAQRRCMLEWLEVPGNFQLLASPAGSATGSGGGVVLKNAKGKKLKKTDGFRALTHYVNAQTQSNWTMETTKSRFESFLTTYRKVKAQATLPEFVVTDNDRSRGINDVRQKLNALCVYYDRIEALFHPQTSGGDASAATEPQADPAVGVEVAEAVAAAGEQPSSDAVVVDAVELEGDDSDHRRKRMKQDDAPPSAEDAVMSSLEPVDVGTTQTETKADEELATPQPVVSTEEVLKQLAMERERLDQLQQQLALQKRQLDQREQQLKQQEETRARELQTQIAAKLIEAGKSADDIKQILEFVAGITPTTDASAT